MWALLIICMMAVICIVALSIIKTKKYLFFLIPVMLGFLFGANIMISLGAGASLFSVWPTIRGGLIACLAAALTVCGGLWIYQFGLGRPSEKGKAAQAVSAAMDTAPVEEPVKAAAEEEQAEEPVEAAAEEEQEEEPAEVAAEEEQEEEPAEVAAEEEQQEEPAEVAAEEEQQEEPAEVAAEEEQEEEPAEVAAEEEQEEEPAEAAAEEERVEEPAEAAVEEQAEEPVHEESRPAPEDPRVLALAKARELAQKGVVTLASGLYRQAMQHDEYDEICRTAGRELMVFLIDSKKYDAARAHAGAAIQDTRLSDAERKWFEIILRRIGA